MNRALPEMLPCLNSPGKTADVSVLERQQARMKWQQQQQQQSYFNGNDHQMFSSMSPAQQFSGYIPGYDGLLNRVIKPDPDLENGWPSFGGGDDRSGYGNGKTTMADQDQMVSFSPKKRKAHESQSLKVVSEKEKRVKGCGEEGDSKVTNTNSREASTDNSSKEKSKISEVQKPDCIHVRARRGQATDSHSLAERVRREKISERMKYLQDLVPGCNKITGKAGMLDEIINYVQSLQRQVEFLSMKLATVHPRLDFNIDNLFTKEMFLSSTSDFSPIGCSSEMANSEYFQLNSLEQVGSSGGLEMGINPMDTVLRSISEQIPIAETFFDSACFNPSIIWDADLQNPYRMEFQRGTSNPFQPQQFTGSNEGRT